MPSSFAMGSVWRKWDLHAHTSIDHEWIGRPDLSTEASRESFAGEYVDSAIRQGLAVIAITDHNFCDQFNNLLIPYIQREATRRELVVLPGFEVTTSDCGGTHLLVVFSEDTNLLTIDDLVKQLFPPGTERFRNHTVLPSSKTAADLHQILLASKQRHLIIFAHADRENGVLYHRGSTIRARLWKSPFIKIAQVSKNPDEFSGFVAAVIGGIDENYKREMTYVLASDCRQLNQDGSEPGRFALGERFTWIKADPTFEGLYQIVYEPYARVRIQDHEPERKPDYLVISSVKFLDNKRRFQTESIPINPALTCIIGGKSTGKSILLSSIANAIDREECEKKAQVSSVNIYDFTDLDLEVSWRDGSKDRLLASNGEHSITFIPQMFIHKLVEGENRPLLSDSILSFLRQNDIFNAKYTSLCDEILSITTNIQSCVAGLLGIRASFHEANSRLKEMGSQAAVEAEQEAVLVRNKALRALSGFTSEETEHYNVLTQQIKEIKNEIDRLKNRDGAFKELIDNVDDAFRKNQQGIEYDADEISSRYQLSADDERLATEALNRFSMGIQAQLVVFEDEIKGVLAEDTLVAEDNEKRLLAANSSIKPFLDKISNQKELAELQDRASILSATLRSILSCNAEIDGIRKQYVAKLQELRRLLDGQMSLKLALSSLFSEDIYSRVGDGISIVAQMQFDNERFQAGFLEQFDLRAPLERLGVSFVDTELVWSEESHVSVIMKILDVLLRTGKSDLRLKTGRTREDAIGALFHDYVRHTLSVRQNDEDILLMSPGKQGLVLLELFLQLSSAAYPILIDQPEDNLDNRTIYKNLVRFLRKKKIQRQIIIVTHNPNLVVGADAEEIIVANQDGEGHGENEEFKFEYVSGSLECSFLDSGATCVLKSQGIREHVCQILEGGADAFKKREQKYNLDQRSDITNSLDIA